VYNHHTDDIAKLGNGGTRSFSDDDHHVSSLEQLDQKKVEVLELSLDHLNLHDTVTLFDDAVEKGDEAKIIHMDRKNKKVVVEYMDGKSSNEYHKIMIHKYQLSISLEII
jgi:hypothetical protein